MKIQEFDKSKIPELLFFLRNHASEHPEIASVSLLEWQVANSYLVTWLSKKIE
jgi:hypothetical protein